MGIVLPVADYSKPHRSGLGLGQVFVSMGRLGLLRGVRILAAGGRKAPPPLRSPDIQPIPRPPSLPRSMSVSQPRRCSGILDGAMSRLTHNCAGVARRDFLQIGIGGILGLGFSDLLRLRASAAPSAPGSSGWLEEQKRSTAS